MDLKIRVHLSNLCQGSTANLKLVAEILPWSNCSFSLLLCVETFGVGDPR
jgi:hypothetical protein